MLKSSTLVVILSPAPPRSAVRPLIWPLVSKETALWMGDWTFLTKEPEPRRRVM